MENVFQNVSNLVQNRQIPDPRTRDVQSPFAARSLETFVDLGLSDRQIARYFNIPETKVVSLRRYYGLDH